MLDELEISSRILWIRGKKVMIDRDLAELYGVTTKRLNEQVKRNASRFPEDFMFQLTSFEKKELVANCDRFKLMRHSTVLPYAFTEHGAVMLACVLNSEIAIQANIKIIRVFTKLREMTLQNKDILQKVEKLEKRVGMHDKELQVIFETIKKMIDQPPPKRNRIGFIRDE
jgi:hypothetical protein